MSDTSKVEDTNSSLKKLTIRKLKNYVDICLKFEIDNDTFSMYVDNLNRERIAEESSNKHGILHALHSDEFYSLLTDELLERVEEVIEERKELSKDKKVRYKFKNYKLDKSIIDDDKLDKIYNALRSTELVRLSKFEIRMALWEKEIRFKTCIKNKKYGINSKCIKTKEYPWWHSTNIVTDVFYSALVAIINFTIFTLYPSIHKEDRVDASYALAKMVVDDNIKLVQDLKKKSLRLLDEDRIKSMGMQKAFAVCRNVGMSVEESMDMMNRVKSAYGRKHMINLIFD